MKVNVLKNGSIIQQFSATESTYQRVYRKAVNIAGGMWNGVDKFTVIVVN
jgi:hypothetical protein